MKKQNKGFTLIELLVVIAIIGILASVVLVSLGSARSKGSDAKIQEQLSNLRTAAELYAQSQTPASYTGLKTVGTSDSSGAGQLILGSNYPDTVAPTVRVNSGGTAWAAFHPLLSDSTKAFCVDSSGTAKIISVTTSGTTGTYAVTDTSPVCQ